MIILSQSFVNHENYAYAGHFTPQKGSQQIRHLELNKCSEHKVVLEKIYNRKLPVCEGKVNYCIWQRTNILFLQNQLSGPVGECSH